VRAKGEYSCHASFAPDPSVVRFGEYNGINNEVSQVADTVLLVWAIMAHGRKELRNESDDSYTGPECYSHAEGSTWNTFLHQWYYRTGFVVQPTRPRLLFLNKKGCTVGSSGSYKNNVYLQCVNFGERDWKIHARWWGVLTLHTIFHIQLPRFDISYRLVQTFVHSVPLLSCSVG